MRDLIIAFAPLIAIMIIAIIFIVLGHRARPHKHFEDSHFGIGGTSTGGPKGDPLKEIEDAADKLGVRSPTRPR